MEALSPPHRVCDIASAPTPAASRQSHIRPPTRIGVMFAGFGAKAPFSSPLGAKPRRRRNLPISQN
jgi:hypothetical protein